MQLQKELAAAMLRKRDPFPRTIATHAQDKKPALSSRMARLENLPRNRRVSLVEVTNGSTVLGSLTAIPPHGQTNLFRAKDERSTLTPGFYGGLGFDHYPVHGPHDIHQTLTIPAMEIRSTESISWRHGGYCRPATAQDSSFARARWSDNREQRSLQSGRGER